MHRFYLPPARCSGPELVLDDREAHHAIDVLRLKRGDAVTVLDGAGGEFFCEVAALERKQVRLAVTRKNTAQPLPNTITLLQALPKGKAMELIVRKATELGARRIIPFSSERVVVHVDDESAASKVDKWRWVAIDAAKQCGLPWLPQIDPPASLKEVLARKESFELALIASLAVGSRHPRDYFRTFEQEQGRRPKSVGVWVGPEGDFTAGETGAIEAVGALPISLGRHVLRSDTAATYCLSIVNYELEAPVEG